METMKAAICTRYGPPDVIRIQTIKKPSPKKGEVRIRIRASAVNSGDVRVRGLAVEGFMKITMRLVLGISKPRKPILGTVFAGTIDTIGTDVSSFRVGDNVFGMTGFGFGCHAEYICLKQDSAILEMPANTSFEEAAALPFGGQTAIYFLEKAGIRERKAPAILIMGATGSVGIATLQIARYYQADITAVCSANGRPLVEELGIYKIIQYDKEDISRIKDRFDIVFDCIGKYPSGICKSLLEKGGSYVSVSKGYASETIAQLQFLKQLAEHGQLKAVIDKTFLLDQADEAHAYVDAGRKKGNVILKIE